MDDFDLALNDYIWKCQADGCKRPARVYIVRQPEQKKEHSGGMIVRCCDDHALDFLTAQIEQDNGLVNKQKSATP